MRVVMRPYVMVVLGSVLLAAGCAPRSGQGTAGAGAPATEPPPGRASATSPARPAIVRDGYFDAGTAVRMRLEIDRVERAGGFSVLRFTVTNLAAAPVAGPSLFGEGRLDTTFSALRLVDPVGRRLYRTLREGGENGTAFGSRYYGTEFAPNVRYEARAYFPALPPAVRSVTLLTPGTTAEIPGVPVAGGGAPRPPEPSIGPPPASPAPGRTVALASEPPSGRVWGGVENLYGIVERRGSTTTTGGGGETVAVPTDVLFAFDSAAPSGRARDVIESAAADLLSRADPRRPVSVVGHTDGKGSPAYNRSLSVRRAAAVRDALRAALAAGTAGTAGGGGRGRTLQGRAFAFRVAGKGATEPVAAETTPDGADNPQGRARNRRVEISYTLRAPAATPAFSAAPAAGGPAAARRADGPVVAERTATVDRRNGPGERIRLRVLPFYRDGAFLVAAFELTNAGTRPYARPPGYRQYFSSLDLPGADYGSFAVVGGDGTIYRAVRRGPRGATIQRYLSGAMVVGDPGVPGRTFLYVPAPPAGTTAVAFTAGVFGTIADVPVR
jgi:outer membrane protein OmpA-like peptidoglycan-associated protein